MTHVKESSSIPSWDKDGDMEETDWNQMWIDKNIGFHRSEVHGKLLKYYDQLTMGKTDVLNFLLPFCGKTVDIKWLADKGHNVVGVEFSEMACKDFFEEQNLEYVTTPMEGVPGGMLYKSIDGKIQIFQCDFYKFTKAHAGEFDVIWDRAALVAVNKTERKKYSEQITSLLKSDGVCLLEVFVYQGTFKGPPHSVPMEVIEELYGDSYSIQLLEENDMLNDAWKHVGMETMHDVIILFRPK